MAQANPAYGHHVEGEIARLGEHHPIVRTQYLLRTVAGGGRFLDTGQIGLLPGEHPPVVLPFRYTAASKSQLAYDFLAAVNAGRFKLHADSADATANKLRRELLRQCEVAEYAMRAHQMMSFFVPEHRGHDDLLSAAALVVQTQPLGALRTATGHRRSERGL